MNVPNVPFVHSQLKTMYQGVPSFSWLYQSPWGSLPACLIGLLLAFLHFELQEAGVKVASYKVSPHLTHADQEHTYRGAVLGDFKRCLMSTDETLSSGGRFTALLLAFCYVIFTSYCESLA